MQEAVERLRFGTDPRTFDQSLVRLPLPGIQYKDEQLQHLGNLRRSIEKTLFAQKHGMPLPSLNCRMVPLGVEDIKFMQSSAFSFKINSTSIMSASWLKLSFENDWSLIFGSSDDDYRNWKISFVSPNLQYANDLRLICVETNSDFDTTRESWRNSDFTLGLVKSSELRELTNDIREQKERYS